MAEIQSGSAGFVAGGERLVQAGRGLLLAVVAGHSQAAAQTVTLYDSLLPSGVVLLRLAIPAGSPPVHLVFPGAAALRFEHGLAISAGACDVHLTTTALGR